MADKPVRYEIFAEPEHDPLSPIPELEGLEHDDAIEAIKEWFFENFEDPAHRTPFESAEGGYIYIWGGPYDTRDIIENVFADTASEQLITAAIKVIERHGAEWVPSESRHHGQEDEPVGDAEPSLDELHSIMKVRVSALQQALAHAPEPPASIGHNKPPEPLEPEPLTVTDKNELTDALSLLKEQPVEPKDNGAAAEAALAVIESKQEKLRKWLLQQGEVFTAEAVKEAGKQFGRWAPTAFWLWLIDQMLGVTHIVQSWLHVIKLPF